jgi:hypothetical protein
VCEAKNAQYLSFSGDAAIRSPEQQFHPSASAVVPKVGKDRSWGRAATPPATAQQQIALSHSLPLTCG